MKDFKYFKEYVKNKKIAVVGVGVSNIPLIHFLIKLNADVTAFDYRDKDSLRSIIDKFKPLGVNFRLGEGYLNGLEEHQIIFRSPSMRIDNKMLIKAKNNGAYITSEIEEFVKYTKGKIYAVTGSDGKTTTTSIIGELLKDEGYKTWVGGNIGTHLFDKIEEIKEEDKIVLELSSFQLMSMNMQVDVAVVTNISPNHLDIHKDMEEYIECKKNIFMHQNESGRLVLNEDNPITNSFKCLASGEVCMFSSKKEQGCDSMLKNNKDIYVGEEYVGNIDEMKIKGIHNAENFMAAFLATKGDVPIETMRRVFKRFAGVEHRCEFIRELNGVMYYNDSIASSPTRTVAGLKAFNNKVILIAGGYDKKIPFDSLAEEGSLYIKELVLIGDTKDKIKKSFDENEMKTGFKIECSFAETLEEAALLAMEKSTYGDIVTLSPACASFDMFENFEVRGNKFKEIINSLK